MVELEIKQQTTDSEFTPRLYKKRWLILLIFCLSSLSNSYHWIHLNIISDRTQLIWNATIPGETGDDQLFVLDWLSMVYMLVYIPLIVPATYLLNRFGLKLDLILACLLNATGAWVKVGAAFLAQPPAPEASPFGFPVLMLGQTLNAVAQIFILGIPAQLAATWFGEREVSTATSIGVFGNQLGVAFGFLIPPIIVPIFADDAVADVYEATRGRMLVMLYVSAALATLPLIPVIFCFKNAPPIPPTYSQYTRQVVQAKSALSSHTADYCSYTRNGDITLTEEHNNHRYQGLHWKKNHSQTADETSDVQVVAKSQSIYPNFSKLSDDYLVDASDMRFHKSLIRLLKNVNFDLLLVSYGIITGVFYAVGTLLNAILLEYFPLDGNIGWVGFTIVTAGIAGSLVVGFVLDHFHKYKLTTLLVYLLTVIWMGVFTGSMYSHSIVLVFVAAFFLGFFMTGYLSIGFEFAAELTYPDNEGITSGLLNAAAQIFGIVLILGVARLNKTCGFLSGNLCMTVVLLIGMILMLLIKEDLRRQRVWQMLTIPVEAPSSASHCRDKPKRPQCTDLSF